MLDIIKDKWEVIKTFFKANRDFVIIALCIYAILSLIF